MKFSVWKKYQLFKILGPLVTILLTSIFLVMKHKLIAIFSLFLGSLCTVIILHSIKCPKCGNAIDNCTTLFSGPEDGMFSPMSKICKNCGCDFTKSE